MKKINLYRGLVFILLSLFTLTSFAWDQSLELGYGYSHDPNHSRYNNSGFLLSGDFYALRHTTWTYWSLMGALGQWSTTAPIHKTLTTGAVALALRLYPTTAEVQYPFYLLASAGPALLSNRNFGLNSQGSNFAFQLNGGLGVEHKHFDANLRMVHYSNAHLAHPDHGFNVLYLFSIGYLF